MLQPMALCSDVGNINATFIIISMQYRQSVVSLSARILIRSRFFDPFLLHIAFLFALFFSLACTYVMCTCCSRNIFTLFSFVARVMRCRRHFIDPSMHILSSRNIMFLKIFNRNSTIYWRSHSVVGVKVK